MSTSTMTRSSTDSKDVGFMAFLVALKAFAMSGLMAINTRIDEFVAQSPAGWRLREATLPKGRYDSGQVRGGMAAQGVAVVVGLTITAIVAAFLLPVGLDEIANVTADWGTGADSLWNILPLIFVLVLFLVVIGWAMGGRRP